MDLQPEADVPSRRQRDVKKVSNLRYWVLGWLLLAGNLNYHGPLFGLDRRPHMIAELGLTKTDIRLMGAVSRGPTQSASCPPAISSTS